jgi:hypothetical protein
MRELVEMQACHGYQYFAVNALICTIYFAVGVAVGVFILSLARRQ